jgi:hypothetical protein
MRQGQDECTPALYHINTYTVLRAKSHQTSMLITVREEPQITKHCQDMQCMAL